MAQSARSLTLMAKYYQYTRDDALLLKYFPKIQGIVGLLEKRRQKSLKFSASDPRYGMPTGNDEADLFRTTANVNTTNSTELPFYSIAAEYIQSQIIARLPLFF